MEAIVIEALAKALMERDRRRYWSHLPEGVGPKFEKALPATQQAYLEDAGELIGYIDTVDFLNEIREGRRTR